MRGYQKRVIYLKNTGSDFFKEAYFVIEDDKKTTNSSTKDLVDEANKIIDENFYRIKKGKIKGALPYLAFLAGMTFMIIIFMLYFSIS